MDKLAGKKIKEIMTDKKAIEILKEIERFLYEDNNVWEELFDKYQEAIRYIIYEKER